MSARAPVLAAFLAAFLAAAFGVAAAAATAQQPPAASPAAAPTAAQRPGDPTGGETVPDELFAGTWRDVADPDHWLVLEPGRARELRDGHATIARAEFDLDHYLQIVWGRRTRVELASEGDAAITTTVAAAGGTATVHWVRAAADVPLPAALDPRPLALGARFALPAERLALLKQELARRHEQDQTVRSNLDGQVSPEQMERMRAVDEDNTAWLTAQIGAIGWIDVARFGKEAALSAFLIVQHSGELPLMLAALPEIERDVKEHGLDGQNFALLWDRTQVNLGRRQRYGSQLGSDEQGRLVVIGLEERATVDARRKALGMGPLKQYVDSFRSGPSARVVVFEDDEAG